jgi:hypothetical protein
VSKALGSKGYLKLYNVFSDDTVEILQSFFENAKLQQVQEEYGRMRYFGPYSSQSLTEEDIELALTKKISDLLEVALPTVEISLCVEYSSKYGEPSLPPHFDGDSTDLIVNYQLEANTDWPVGVDTRTVRLDDNSALLFNPNTSVHWRPVKKFEEGEYVRMIFFRFIDPVNPTDNSQLKLKQNHAFFDEARKARGTFS